MKKYRARTNREFMNHSHLRKHLQKQSVRNLLMGIGGTLSLLIVMVLYGPDLLINLSLLFNKPTTIEKTKEDTKNIIYVEPPTIEPLSEATNSASVTIRGTALPKQTVKLYHNDKFIDKTTAKANRKFTFLNVTMTKGANEFKTKTVTASNKESDFSPVVKIKYIDKKPTLEITNPQDGQTLSKGNNQIKITGKTDEGVNVTINDLRAIVEGNGSFSYFLKLNDGENTLKFVATDRADNTTEKEIKVKVE